VRFLLVSCNYNAWPHVEASVEASVAAKTEYESCGLGNVEIVYRDNGSIDPSRTFIESTAFLGVHPILGANIGKAKGINEIVKSREGSYDVIVSLDSDMKIDNPHEFFFDMDKAFSKFGSKVSAIIAWQTGNSLFKRKFAWTDTPCGLSYFAPKEGYGHGIAGGCIAVSAADWKAAGGYDENRGVYGSNDGQLMLRLYRQTNKPICVIKQLATFHPPEKDPEYGKWKEERQQEQLKYGKCMSSVGFYDNQEENSNHADVQS